MTVSCERVGRALLVTIDRPEVRNAIDGPTAEALLESYRRFEADDSARVLVLTGAGEKAFCAGADLKELATLLPRLDGPSGPLGFTRLLPSKPTIAAIGGWCVAGGLELALWCDLRVCARGSLFGCLERRWGVPLIDGGTQRLPRVVGLGRALDLILTGRQVSSEEALAIGLVTEVVEPGTVVARALELAEGLASLPQDALLADRRAALEGSGLDLASGLALEARIGGTAARSALAGASRFSSGEGRGGRGSGV
jgi:enoyl-CoA hydratase